MNNLGIVSKGTEAVQAAGQAAGQAAPESAQSCGWNAGVHRRLNCGNGTERSWLGCGRGRHHVVGRCMIFDLFGLRPGHRL